MVVRLFLYAAGVILVAAEPFVEGLIENGHSMVVVFNASAGQVLTFPLDGRQAIEFLLTTAVSVFGLLLVARQVVDWRLGAVLPGLFVVHLFFPSAQARLWTAFVYFGLAALLVILDWRRVRFLFREESASPDWIRLSSKRNVATVVHTHPDLADESQAV